MQAAVEQVPLAPFPSLQMVEVGHRDDPSAGVAVAKDLPNSVPAIGRIDWDAIQADDRCDEEGEQEVIDEHALYSLLGLSDEDEIEQRAREEEACRPDGDAECHTTDGADSSVDRDSRDHVPNKRVISYDKDDPEVKLGSLFPSIKEFRLAMRQYAMNKGFELGVQATCSTRYRGFCRAENCPWRVHARLETQGSPIIIVSVMVDQHTCTLNGQMRPNKNWVVDKALPVLTKNPFIGTKELQTTLQDMYKVDIAYDTVWKGQQAAMQELCNTWEDSFQQLFRWKEAVMEKMPGSVVEIDVREEDHQLFFRRFFCTFGPCIQGFVEGCRPYLSVGSTALTGRWNGYLPSATGVDGHSWMFPVAFGFFDSETEDNWIWFMSQLHKAVGHLNPLAICIDACKGLENAVGKVFPDAEKRVCFRRMMGSYEANFAGSEHMYPAARAHNRHVYEHHIGNVRCDPAIAQWLDTYQNFLWYRSGFNPAIKCDYITNNVTSMFNSWIKEIKDLPVCELADKIREMIMDLFRRRRRIGEKLHGKILPSIIHFLKAKARGLGHLTLFRADDYAAEVQDDSNGHSRHVVYAYLQECTCAEWQHTGKPCQHALCLIVAQQSRDVAMENFVHDYYSVENFQKAYKGRVQMLPDKSVWPVVEIAQCVGAPLSTITVGQHRKNAIKGCLEGGSGKKPTGNETEKVKKMIRSKFKCPNCGQLGHRKNSPKCPYNEPKKRKRKPRINITKGYFPKTVDKDTSKQQDEVVQQAEEVVQQAEEEVVQQAEEAPSPPSPPPPRIVRRVVRKISVKM